jgi:hypothetical protein
MNDNDGGPKSSKDQSQEQNRHPAGASPRWLPQTNLWRKPTNPRTWSDLLKRYRPEGDLGEAKNKHLLPPPQSEELMELKLDDATEFVAALAGERHD